MKSYIIVIILLLSKMYCYAQVNELENFRTILTQFVHYDRGKKDTITKATTTNYKLMLDSTFIQFIVHPQSNNLDNLKKSSTHNKSSYWFKNYSYFFSDLRRSYAIKSLENNVNYHITFYGLYDYGLPNFVSFYIQPFTVQQKEYVVYYYKLNGTGTYFIKDAATNLIVYKGSAVTSNAAILNIQLINKQHLLIIEQMDDNGQRALVVEAKKNSWLQLAAFKGNGFKEGTMDYTIKTNIGKRLYLHVASNRTIQSMGYSNIKNYDVVFNDTTQTIFYHQYNKTATNKLLKIAATWKNKSFTIDDYYLGEHIDDKPLPYPSDEPF